MTAAAAADTAARHRLASKKAYQRAIATGRCASCRVRKARPNRRTCHQCGKRQNAAAKLRYAMRQAEIEGLKLLLERMAA